MSQTVTRSEEISLQFGEIEKIAIADARAVVRAELRAEWFAAPSGRPVYRGRYLNFSVAP